MAGQFHQRNSDINFIKDKRYIYRGNREREERKGSDRGKKNNERDKIKGEKERIRKREKERKRKREKEIKRQN